MSDFEGAADRSLEVVRDSEGYATLLARTPFAAGALVAPFGAREELRAPNYLTVQVAADRHILLAPEHLQYINHSCEPNVFFDTAHGKIVALRDIAADEPITFFYPSTEWTMDRAFACHCGTPSCLGQIAGASQLPPAVIARYRLADHIAAALAGANAEA
ncbi:MAG: SET domain-containing protein-lysine N-methyltransferase [Sphingomonadales bacterium]|nr:SET domain-containing protein-lysine N-methyltransferase [Sphingomonadales bacterium]